MVNNGNQWLSVAEKMAKDVLARHAPEVDREGCWPTESITALGESGLMGLTLKATIGGKNEGPATFADVTRTLAAECASTAMIYLMHTCGAQVIAAAPEFPQKEALLGDIAEGRHLSTLAFSEKGSRSHFWAPISQERRDGSDLHISAQKSWVTSAGHADSYIVSTRAAVGTDPTASTLYCLPRKSPGFSVSGAWNGLGLRGNGSAPMRLENVLVSPSQRVSREGEGFATMMNTVLPWFLLGSAAVSIGIARAAVESTCRHLLNSKLEHLGQPLSSLMNLRARLAQMNIAVDVHQAYLENVARHIEQPGPQTMVAVLQSKAAAAEAALHVTDLAMRACGGAAFSGHLSVERNFRDARAGWVMAPTTDVLYDFIGKSLLGLPLF